MVCREKIIALLGWIFVGVMFWFMGGYGAIIRYIHGDGGIVEIIFSTGASLGLIVLLWSGIHIARLLARWIPK